MAKIVNYDVVLYGKISGKIWDGSQCWKPFRVVFSTHPNAFQCKWNGLISAFSELLKDGDFESCEISELGGEVVYYMDNHTKIVKDLQFKKADIFDRFFDWNITFY